MQVISEGIFTWSRRSEPALGSAPVKQALIHQPGCKPYLGWRRRLGSQRPGSAFLTLPCRSCAASENSLNLSEPQMLSLQAETK